MLGNKRWRREQEKSRKGKTTEEPRILPDPWSVTVTDGPVGTDGVDGIEPWSVGVTYGLVGTDGVDLGTEHHRGEYEEEEGLEAQEDEEDYCGRGGEGTALWNAQGWEWGEGGRGGDREVRG